MDELNQPEIVENEDGSANVTMPDIDADIQEMPDGSAIVNLVDEGPEESPDFYQNMAEEYDQFKLMSLGMRYIDLVQKDKDAREERDKKYEEGLKRTGMGNDAPGGATFMGASKVVHPAMAEGDRKSVV